MHIRGTLKESEGEAGGLGNTLRTKLLTHTKTQLLQECPVTRALQIPLTEAHRLHMFVGGWYPSRYRVDVDTRRSKSFG